jgi:PKD repeat protein
MKISILKSVLINSRKSLFLSIALIALFCSNNVQSKTNFEFVNLRPLDTTSSSFYKIWFMNNDVYAFYDGSKILFKKGINSALNAIQIDTINKQLTVSSVQMNDFDEFMVQLTNNEIYLLKNEFKDIQKITQLFSSKFKFLRIVCDHANNFYAFNDSLIYCYNSKTSVTKLLKVPNKIALKDIFVEKSGKIWLLSTNKLYWTNDFEVWNEAKINGVELYYPVAITESDVGNIYVALNLQGIICKLAEKDEFNFVFSSIPIIEKCSFNNIWKGFIQINSSEFSYVNYEDIQKWEIISRQLPNKNIFNKFNKRYEFISTISKIFIFDSLIVSVDTSNNWKQYSYWEKLDFHVSNIINIKEDFENDRFYTFQSNNYYFEWDYKTGVPLKFKLIPIKNNNTDNDLVHKKVYFTQDWKYYFYLTVKKNVLGYNIELYENKNDSLIRNFSIDNSNDTIFNNFPIRALKSNPLSLYYPSSGDFFISFKNDISYGQQYLWGNKGHGGLYRINLKNMDIVIKQICKEYTPDFKVDLKIEKLFYSNQYYDYGMEITIKGQFLRSWDNRISSLYYFDFKTNNNKMLTVINAIAGSFLEVDTSFSNILTNYDTNLVKYYTDGNYKIISPIGKYFFNKGKSFDNNRYIFFEDRHFGYPDYSENYGSYNFFNIENDYLFKNIPIPDLRSWDADFDKESKTLIVANTTGDIQRYTCTDNFKVKSDFKCINYCWINQNLQFTADSNGYNQKFYWDFGDGDTSSLPYPIKSYSMSGNYDVTLKVYNNFDTLSIIKPACVIVNDSVKADFDADFKEGLAPLTVKFTSLSKGDIKYYEWNLGDNAVSIEKDPIYTYTKPGKYSVNLLVHDNHYQSSKSIPDYIKVIDPLDVNNCTQSLQTFRIINVSENKIVIDFNYIDNIPNSIIIYDIFGNVVEKFENLSSSTSRIRTFDLKNKLMTGVYFIRVMIDNKVQTHKFIYTD